MRRKRSAAEITDVLEQFHTSGLTRLAFCQQTGIALSTLGRYLKLQSRQQRLIKVNLEPAPAPDRGFVLVLCNGRRIECGEAGLAQLIRTAEAVS